jgi:hypothetical protein
MAFALPMTFANLDEALRAGFHVYDDHPDGYLVRKAVLLDGGRRWVLAIAFSARKPESAVRA